jgi:hypothetical protein
MKINLILKEVIKSQFAIVGVFMIALYSCNLKTISPDLGLAVIEEGRSRGIT